MAQSLNIPYAEDGGPTILGEHYANPYTPENMQAAKDALVDEGIISPVSFSVETSHYYVKFSPQNLTELKELYSDTSLVLHDYPLDYEIIKLGNWYREEGLADSVPTPQYAAVPKNFNFNPNVPYEILSPLYIPEEDPIFVGNPNSGGEGNNLKYVIQILNRGYLLKQLPNKFLLDTIVEGGILEVDPPPTGTIRIYDNRLGQNIPLEGVKVTATLWFTTHQGITHSNGEYTLNGSFINPAWNYTIHFQRANFIIADYVIVPHISMNLSKIVRNNISGNHWSYTIAPGYENMQGHMFRAAYRYYYKDIDGLSRPMPPLSTQILVAKNSVKNWSGINYIVAPLKIARYKSTSVEYGSDEIFSSTIHELAHTAHANLMSLGAISYVQVSDLIRESWPIAVEWYLTSKEYKELGISNYGDPDYNPFNPPQYPNHYEYQYWNSSLDPDYTSLFINLIDDYNENGVNFQGLLGEVNDNLSGYTPKYIEENILSGVYGLSSLKTQLKNNKPSGVTDTQIDELLNYY